MGVEPWELSDEDIEIGGEPRAGRGVEPQSITWYEYDD